jgi:hypothetical protein
MRTILTAQVCILFIVLSPALSKAQKKPYGVGSEKQLFIDESLIGSKSNVILTMNPPVKTMERNVVAEHPWEELGLGWFSVLEVNGSYKMWYACSSIDQSSQREPGVQEGQRSARDLCYATSADGIKWHKPELGLIDFRGSRQNNIVMKNVFGAAFLDPRKIDGNLYKFAGSRRPNRGLEIYTSPDGLRWKPFREEPVLSKGHFDTQNQIFWDERISQYVTYVRRWDGYSESRVPLCCRKVGRSVSRDLANWPEPEIVFRHDDRDPVESDAYNASVVKYPGTANAYFMFPSSYFHYPKRKNEGPLDIQLGTSRDGIKWRRIQREPYLRLGVDGTFDDGAIYMAVGMFLKDSEIWMYYTSSDIIHGALDAKRSVPGGSISRVVQRLDGFISADAAYTGGELTTIPIVFRGGELSLNLDTGALGETRVEISDEKDRVIPGFSANECDAINGNYIARTVTWQGKSDVSKLAGRAVKLRFVMRNTKLYALQFRC